MIQEEASIPASFVHCGPHSFTPGHIRSVLAHIRSVLTHIRSVLAHIRSLPAHILSVLAHIRSSLTTSSILKIG